jgi:alpha-D-ribose 1-methylphosphonate 5-triphosphate diphosphatase
MRNRWTIAGGRIVMPGGILDGHTLVIEDGVIQGSRPDRAADAPADLNVNGAWIMPGMIDSHSDAIENEMQPRPTSRFPIELSFMELERKLAAQGITTIYHSLSMLDDEANNWARRNDNVAGFIRKIRELAVRQRLIHHKLHLRFEMIIRPVKVNGGILTRTKH